MSTGAADTVMRQERQRYGQLCWPTGWSGAKLIRQFTLQLPEARLAPFRKDPRYAEPGSPLDLLVEIEERATPLGRQQAPDRGFTRARKPHQYQVLTHRAAVRRV